MALVTTDRKVGYFNSYILQRIENNKNFVACVTGSTGSGKSWSTLRLGEILDPDFNIDNVCFTARQFLDLINGKVKPLKKGSNIIFDEIQVTLGHLDYQSVQSKLLNYVLQTFRHKNFVLWVTSPNFNYINKTARLLFHARIETVSIDKKNKQVRLKPYLMQVNQKKSDVYEKWLRVWTKDGGISPLKVLKVSMPSKELIKAYEEKKTAFTQELNESIARDLRKLEGTEQKPLTEKQKEVVMMLKEGLTIPEIAKRMDKIERSIYEHLELIKKKGIKIKAIREENRVIRYEISGFDED